MDNFFSCNSNYMDTPGALPPPLLSCCHGIDGTCTACVWLVRRSPEKQQTRSTFGSKNDKANWMHAQSALQWSHGSGTPSTAGMRVVRTNISSSDLHLCAYSGLIYKCRWFSFSHIWSTIEVQHACNATGSASHHASIVRCLVASCQGTVSAVQQLPRKLQSSNISLCALLEHRLRSSSTVLNFAIAVNTLRFRWNCQFLTW